jgi:hypothetical protein
LSHCDQYNHQLFNDLGGFSFGLPLAMHSGEVKIMSLRTKIIVLAFGALAAIAGLGLDLTTLKNSLSVVVSAVWGS